LQDKTTLFVIRETFDEEFEKKKLYTYSFKSIFPQSLSPEIF